MKFKIYLISFFYLLSVKAFSQTQLNYQNAVPSSPEVASIAKYSDIPVSYSSGTPQISVPIYSLVSGNIEIPISVSYNASGIRVEEAATWVGLGWNLSSGPSLARVVKGLPDEAFGGFMNVPSYYKVKHINSLPVMSEERSNFEHNIYPFGGVDLEQDIYSFSAFGYSGKFYWSQDSSKFIFSPFQNILLETTTLGFTLTLPNGLKCLFGSSEDEKLTSSESTAYIDGYAYAAVQGTQSPYKTGWMIKKIIDASGKQIEYFYTNEFMVTEFGRAGEVKKWIVQGTAVLSENASYYKQKYTKPILQKIIADNSEVFFLRNSDIREDVANFGKSLDTIIVKSKLGLEIKSYLFDYDYNLSADSSSLWGLQDMTSVSRKRLVLKSIQQKNITANIAMPPYEFSYNSTPLPNRLSSSQDYWGYFNGKSNTYNLMPRIPRKLFIPSTDIYMDSLSWGYMLPGADRRIDTNYSQAGMLTKIKYPTGGTVNYYYEQNKAPAWQFDNNAGIERPDLIEKSFKFFPLLYAQAPYPRDYSDTFRITGPLTKVYCSPILPAPCEEFYNNSSCLYTITIKNEVTSVVVSNFQINAKFYVELPQGLYRIECHVNGSSDDVVQNFSVRLDWGESPDTENFLVGGNRIKKIVLDDGFGNKIAKSFTYGSENIPTLSSGNVAGFPVHMVKEYDTTGQFLRFSFVSNSSIPLTTDGQTIRYSYVTEFYDSTQSSFKTEYKFSHDPILIKFGSNEGTPITTHEWQNGLQMNKKIYEKNGENYRIRSDESTLYQPNQMFSEIAGLSGSYLRPYQIASEYFVPISSNVINYTYPLNLQVVQQNSTANSYNEKYLLAKSRNINSKNEVIDSKIWYATDYNDLPGYNINSLLIKNLISLPIKQETSVNGKIITGNIIKYNENGVPNAIYKYEKNIPLDTVIHDKGVYLESNYTLKSTVQYDVDGNLKQIGKVNDITSSYIWSNELEPVTQTKIDVFPIAIVQNADSNSIAYTSFEAFTKGNWNYAGVILADPTCPTGKKCYYLTGNNISKSILNTASIYIVSYWSKNGSYLISGSTELKQGATLNGWTNYEHEISGVSTLTISGTGYIDEVRLFPKAALMTTYTYNPSIGIASICDNNNRISYYEYDNLNRLSLIKNQNKEIIKKICYNYNGQVEDCGLGTGEYWKVVDSYCEMQSGINTGNLIRIEKNVNPNNFGYGSSRTITITGAAECPLTETCNVNNCVGESKKCINGICETGIKYYTGSAMVGPQSYKCFYFYLWSDSSQSQEYFEMTNHAFCPINL